MLKVLDCTLDAHDPWLVSLAALVCALSCFKVIELVRHAQGTLQLGSLDLHRGLRWRLGYLSDTFHHDADL